MLAAGTTALFGGLGWMLASHAVNKVPREAPQEDTDIRAYCFLADLGGWLTFGAAMATTLIMSETSIDYLHFVLGHRPALWLAGTIVTFCALMILLDFVVVYIRTKNLNRSLAKLPSQRSWRCGRSRSPRWERCSSRSPRHGLPSPWHAFQLAG